MHTPEQQGLETLRITKEDWRGLMARLDRNVAPTPSRHDRRSGKRARARAAKEVLIELRHPGGTRSFYRVFPRNISTNGMAFIHGRFVHKNSQVLVALMDRNGQPLMIPGTVMHCRHVEGKVHEVGIAFDEPVALEDFLAGPSLPADASAA